MLKFLSYVVLLLISSILSLFSFITATFGLALVIVCGSRIEWLGVLMGIALFGIAYCGMWLAKFFDPSFLYYEEDY